MSFLVCHAMKFSGSLKGIENHIERKTKKNKNPDVDFSQTFKNFDALTGLPENEKNIKYEKKFQKIMSEYFHGKRSPRKDSVKMISVVISSDKKFFENLSDEEIKKFFEVSAKFLKAKFPHVLSAVVHMDEKTPHMHFTAVPLTADGRLCAKEVVNRQTLLFLQKKLPEDLCAEGFEISRGIEGSEKKHENTDEWKRTQAINARQAKQLKKELEDGIVPEKNFFRRATGNVILSRSKFDELTTTLAKVGDITAKEQQLTAKEQNLIAKEDNINKTISSEIAKQMRAEKKNLSIKNNEFLTNAVEQLTHEITDKKDLEYQQKIENYKESNNLNALLQELSIFKHENTGLKYEQNSLKDKLLTLTQEISAFKAKENEFITVTQALKDKITNLQAEKKELIKELESEKELSNTIKINTRKDIKLVISTPDGLGRGLER